MLQTTNNKRYVKSVDLAYEISNLFGAIHSKYTFPWKCKDKKTEVFNLFFACYRGGEDNGFVIMRLYCGVVHVVCIWIDG